ncbi:MAG TPA: hypothetical protein PK073_06295 [Ignavibacteriaceae bacterium]|nr:hypothetical protein [Ignavibacteriaceae bacterium]
MFFTDPLATNLLFPASRYVVSTWKNKFGIVLSEVEPTTCHPHHKSKVVRQLL